MNIAGAICQHLMGSGFACHPPGSFGPMCGEGEFGAARLYIGSAHEWLHTDRNSEYLVDIRFNQSQLQVIFHQDSYECYVCKGTGFLTKDHIVRLCHRCNGQNVSRWRSYFIHYSDPHLFAKLYDVLRLRAETHHRE